MVADCEQIDSCEICYVLPAHSTQTCAITLKSVFAIMWPAGASRSALGLPLHDAVPPDVEGPLAHKGTAFDASVALRPRVLGILSITVSHPVEASCGKRLICP